MVGNGLTVLGIIFPCAIVAKVTNAVAMDIVGVEIMRNAIFKAVNGKFGPCVFARDVLPGDTIDDPKRCKAMVVDRVHHYSGLAVLYRADGTETVVPCLSYVRIISDL
jgi:hypothetical protein